MPLWVIEAGERSGSKPARKRRLSSQTLVGTPAPTAALIAAWRARPPRRWRPEIERQARSEGRLAAKAMPASARPKKRP
jgi:hypothetical protein